MKYKRQMLEAKKIALDYEEQTNKNNNGKWTIKFQGIHGVPGEWTVAYSCYNEEGYLMDGPIAMVIDGEGKIRSLGEHIMNEVIRNHTE